MRKILPLLDQVLVQQHEADKKFGNIVIPEIEQKKPNTGTVIRAAESTGFKKGEDIIFDKHSNPMPVMEGDKEYILISSNKIFAKIT